MLITRTLLNSFRPITDPFNPTWNDFLMHEFACMKYQIRIDDTVNMFFLQKTLYGNIMMKADALFQSKAKNKTKKLSNS